MIEIFDCEGVINLDKIARYYSQYNSVLNKELKNKLINPKDFNEDELKSIKIL